MITTLPPIHEDPTVTGALKTRADYDIAAGQIRGNTTLTDLQVAQQITATWESANKAISTAFNDLRSRQHARIQELENVVPFGPAIPTDASAADVVVLQQAFRTSLAEARAAITRDEGVSALLADAEKFDDDNMRRAVLTAAAENDRLDLVRSWTDRMGVTDQLDELLRLRDAVAGRGMGGMWAHNAFTPIPKPTEAHRLGDLERAAAAEIEARRTRYVSPQRRTLY